MTEQLKKSAQKRFATGLVTRHRRLHRLQRQSHHCQTGLPLWRRCGHPDHVPHAVCTAYFCGDGMVGQPRQSSVDAQRLAGHAGAGVHGLLLGQLSGFCGFGLHQRGFGAVDFVFEPHAGVDFGLVVVQKEDVVQANWGDGAELCGDFAGLWA